MSQSTPVRRRRRRSNAPELVTIAAAGLIAAAVLARSVLTWAVITAALVAVAYLVLVPWLLGWPENSRVLRVGILQGNVPQFVRLSRLADEYSFPIYEQLTKNAARAGSDLIIWPETATADYLLNKHNLLAKHQDLIREAGRGFLIGAPYYDPLSRKNYNFPPIAR